MKFVVYFTYTMHSGLKNSCGSQEYDLKEFMKKSKGCLNYDDVINYINDVVETHRIQKQKQKNRRVDLSFEPSYNIIKVQVKKSLNFEEKSEEATSEDLPEKVQEWDDDSKEEDYPRGWKNRKKFIAKDGKYYERGDLIPENYRTEEPSQY